MKIIVNLQEAYNLEKRAYSQSMVGLLATSSPYNSSVGVTREVAWNANINSVRGYMTPGSEDNVSNANPLSMGAAAELVTTFAMNHDDPYFGGLY